MPTEYRHSPVTVRGKTAVVIGGTSGIGRAIALGFAEDGADVVASSRTRENVEKTAAELRSTGAKTLEQTCNVTDRESLVALRDRVHDELGQVDILVNSPSFVSRTSLADASDSDWNDVFAVQLDGTYRSTQVFAAEMDNGSIINISSLSARIAIPNLVPYSAAKGGIESLTRVSAKELGPNIRVNAIRPGFIRTDQTDGTYDEGSPRYEEISARTVHGRLGRPDEITGAAIYLASDAASYTTGSVLTIDDGFAAHAFDS
ncbi:SDR family NAD(P)-dependent oxidoreductase [Haloferax sp. DFSO52]|uniref:SDR family NAD(P)-dependent oxidoreductase n=1 Tax=Haloferax sp. DFSO52 TaxID=3388505 RepID=UPI003A846AAF